MKKSLILVFFVFSSCFREGQSFDDIDFVLSVFKDFYIEKNAGVTYKEFENLDVSSMRRKTSYLYHLSCLNADVYLIRDIGYPLTYALALYNKELQVVEFLLNYGGVSCAFVPADLGELTFLNQELVSFDIFEFECGLEEYLNKVNLILDRKVCEKDFFRLINTYRGTYVSVFHDEKMLLQDAHVDDLDTLFHFLGEYDVEQKRHLIDGLYDFFSLYDGLDNVYLYLYLQPAELYIIQDYKRGAVFSKYSYSVKKYSF